MRKDRDYINELSNRVIGAELEVRTELGPGLLESAYESCLCRELTLRGIPFSRQLPCSLNYKGEAIDVAYRVDLLVDECLLLELKAIEKLLPQHTAQTLTYLKLSKRWLALLLNFNVPHMKDGIVRIVNGNPP